MRIARKDNSVADLVLIQMVKDSVAVGAVAVPCILLQDNTDITKESPCSRGGLGAHHIHWDDIALAEKHC